MFTNLQEAYSGWLIIPSVIENWSAELVVNNILWWSFAVTAPSSTTKSSFSIWQSLRFNDDDSAYLSWTPSVEWDRQKWTFSTWVKRGNLLNSGDVSLISTATSINDSNFLTLIFRDDAIALTAATVQYFSTNSLYRDTSAYYNIVLSVDTTQSVASDRLKLYVNGNQITSFSSISYPAQNTSLAINNNALHTIWITNEVGSLNRKFDGYLAWTYFIDGQALTSDDFWSFDSIYWYWKPKSYTWEYGANGFALDYSDWANIWADI